MPRVDRTIIAGCLLAWAAAIILDAESVAIVAFIVVLILCMARLIQSGFCQ